MGEVNFGQNLCKQTISATIPDFSREVIESFWQPGKKLLASIRRYQRALDNTGLFTRLISKVAVLQHRFWSVVTGADIPLNSNLGGGLLITHPNGIVIHPKAKIG